jgi:2-polyprenyl-3-methyl-5-hydroxy-6-metoxy-1,4-benzoquinol methylase
MDHFKLAAPTWDTPEKVKTSEEYANKIKSKLKKSETLNILEVGCGTGLLGGNFIDGKNKLLGIDTSPEMLQIFKEKFSQNTNVHSGLVDLEKNDIDKENFDLIISSMAFHHLQDPFSVLKKLKKMLVPSGVVAIIDLDKEDGSFHPDPKAMGVYHSGFDRIELSNWGSELNFSRVEYQIINTLIKNDKQYPIFLMIYGL